MEKLYIIILTLYFKCWKGGENQICKVNKDNEFYKMIMNERYYKGGINIMIKKVNKTEVANIIGMHPKSLRRLSSEQIEKRLLQNCWELVKVEKQGRNLLYTLKYKETEIGDNIILWLVKEYGIKKDKEFTGYLHTRLESSSPLSRMAISKELGVSQKTIEVWDKILEEKGVISKGDKVKVFLKEQATEPITPLITPSMVTKLRGD